ncbi:MAG: Bax inhibitor-1/YccA family protein [Gemmataceae bacterium]
MYSSNPALPPEYFLDDSRTSQRTDVMTVNGAITKSGVLVVLLVAAAALAWSLVHPDRTVAAYDATYRIAFGIGAPLAGLVVAFITCFVPRVSPITAPLYAVLQGLMIGTVSSFFSVKYQGIVLQAGILTTGVLALMSTIYVSGIFRPGARFAMGLSAAIGAVCIASLAQFGLSFAGIDLGLWGAGPIGIAFTGLCVALASFSLLMDFKTIEEGAMYQAPKYMEWFAAFGLIVTLVWLYVSILRLLVKLRQNESR